MTWTRLHSGPIGQSEAYGPVRPGCGRVEVDSARPETAYENIVAKGEDGEAHLDAELTSYISLIGIHDDATQ